MPIRIERDKDNRSYTPRGGGSSGGIGGGGGGLIRLLPMLIGLFGRNPKMLILIVVIGAVIYFMGGKGCNTGLPTQESGLNSLATGAEFDEKKYDATEIFEPLADNVRNPLPEKYSLKQFAPTALNQGQQGSCVAWASAYAARTIMEAREQGVSPNSVRFSPSFLYNQIALEDCQGAYLPEALKVMKNRGLAPFEEFPYTDQSCSDKPGQYELKKAADFKIDGYQRLTIGDDINTVDMLAIKQNIAQGAPVLIGMMVGSSFMQGMIGNSQWVPADSDYNMSGFGGHAMCVIGYDDYAFAQNMGGFEIMNSWGEEWGKKGIGWVSYSDFQHFVKESFGLFPGGDAKAPATSVLNAQLGIVLNDSDKNLEFRSTGKNTFTTSRKMKAGEKFKLQVSNNIPCYVYVFGMETDGSSYILFPYTEKHSPFCGITGTRLFPRDHSLFPDKVGTKDYFAIVVSQSALDYNALKAKLNSASGPTYSDKITQALNPGTAQFRGGKSIDLTMDFRQRPMTAVVIEVEK